MCLTARAPCFAPLAGFDHCRLSPACSFELPFNLEPSRTYAIVLLPVTCGRLIFVVTNSAVTAAQGFSYVGLILYGAEQPPVMSLRVTAQPPRQARQRLLCLSWHGYSPQSLSPASLP